MNSFHYTWTQYHIVFFFQILDYILKGNRLPQPENCPDSVYEIMNQCWDEDSKKRPSFYLLCSDLIPKEIQKLPEDLLEQVF